MSGHQGNEKLEKNKCSGLNLLRGRILKRYQLKTASLSGEKMEHCIYVLPTKMIPSLQKGQLNRDL